MSADDYDKALKRGEKEYHAQVSKGHYPYLPVLDEILSHTEVETRTNLGVIEIPLELIVGTSTQGRTTAFASNFMPLLKPRSEFANKWELLSDQIVAEGQRDPIVAFEFMNKYYVVEGNKRVSVSKYLNNVSVEGQVTRIVPKKTDDPDVLLYYEYIEFYNLTKINYIWVTTETGFSKLLFLTGSEPGVPWTPEQRALFRSHYLYFSREFAKAGGEKLNITPADAMIAYMTIYGYDSFENTTPAEMKDNLSKMWDEFLLLEQKDDSVSLIMEPAEAPTKNIISKLFSPEPTRLRAAFIYDKPIGSSSWIYSHELGRMHVEQFLGDRVETCAFENINNESDALEIMEKLIADGYDIIFTTTPNLQNPSLKVAIEHPEVKILNCSLNTSHRYMRTYYGRMYEAKFLAGAIAGSLTENDKIGYIADYPIFGMTANINAFALGAQMVNPRAKVYLEWSTVKDRDINQIFHDNDVSYISSNKEMSVPQEHSREFGLYHLDKDGSPQNIALSVWHWGIMYEKILNSILSGSWKTEDNESNQAINYWWGMSTGVVEVICSQHVSLATRKLADLLTYSLLDSNFSPFYGELYDQNHVLRNQKDKAMSPEEIMTMDWLVSNIIGSIPSLEELKDEAKPVVFHQGVIETESVTPLNFGSHNSKNK